MSEDYDGYVAWKQWGTEFGKPKRGDAEYFRSELRDAQRRHPVRRVLEIGYGNGAFLGSARAHGWEVVGTELIPDLVDIAREHGFEAYLSEELHGLKEQAPFDTIVAFDVFEHIMPDEAVEFLRSLTSLLAPGGTIVLRYPNGDAWLGNVFFNGDPTHVNAIGRLKLQYYAEQTGLEIVRYRAARRRGFSTSVIHGLHRATLGIVAKLLGGFNRLVYFPDVPVVLSHGNVVATLAVR